MLPTTLDAVKAILRTDPTVTPADRADIIALIRGKGKGLGTSQGEPKAENRIVHRAEVARRLSCSLRTVDSLTRHGLKKVVLPGRTRACGFRMSDIEKLISTEG